MKTYIRSTPCTICGGTDFYKSNHHCAWCNVVNGRQFRQSDEGRTYHREYMRKRRSDPAYRHQQKVNAYMREQGSAV